jgi:transcription antitermination factor NusA-like protein
MVNVIDMQSMRQMNLFSQISHVQTKHFFSYNNTLVFGVPMSKVSQAIGRDASNIKQLNQILRRKIKVIAMPEKDDVKGIIRFVTELVEPVELNKVELNGGKLEINATRINRAVLIGRNRIREKELIKILKSAFGIVELIIA